MAPLITNKPAWRRNGTLNDALSIIRSYFSAVLCSRDWILSGTGGGQVSVSQKASLHINACYNSNPTFATFSCSAHLPGLKWHDRFVRPPTLASLCDISTWAAGSVPSVIPVWLSGHLGPRQCLAEYSEQTWDVAKGCQERTQWIGSGAALWLKGHEVQWTSGALNH